MRRRICLLASIVMLAGLARGAHPQAPLRYDGIYQSQAEECEQGDRHQYRT